MKVEKSKSQQACITVRIIVCFRLFARHVAFLSGVLLVVACLVVGGCGSIGERVSTGSPWPRISSSSAESSQPAAKPERVDTSGLDAFELSKVPAYSGKPSVAVNGNVPFFQIGNDESASVETYSPLDKLGRCSTAVALVGKDIMPTEPRGEIGDIKPSGWKNARYEWVNGKYLYNRCHLIAYQLSGENANERNLITGTRSMNTEGMMRYENMVADYVRATGNHVYYRVTPVFKGKDLVARGVLIEAESVEDGGSGVRFCVWCYNVEPGVVIDYATGANHAEEGAAKDTATSKEDRRATLKRLKAELALEEDFHKSLYHGEKAGMHQKYIVLHDTETGGSPHDVVDAWTSDGAHVAAHFVIGKDGSVLQCVPLDKIAHHAGFGDAGHNKKYDVADESRDDKRGTSPIGSAYPDYGMNSYSVGIELVHKGGAGEGYPTSQLAALDKLIAYIDAYYGFESKIIDHKMWRSSNSDTSEEFAAYLKNYKKNRSYKNG